MVRLSKDALRYLLLTFPALVWDEGTPSEEMSKCLVLPQVILHTGHDAMQLQAHHRGQIAEHS